MLVRVRSKDGIFRFPLEPTDDAEKLIEQVLASASNADPATLTLSNQPRGGEMRAEDLRGNTLSDLGIAHGHLLYASYKEKVADETPETPAAQADAAAAAGISNGAAVSSSTVPVQTNGATRPPSSLPQQQRAPKPWETAVEDPVDVFWETKDGKIPRPKDAKFCRHGDKAMCDYCMPLEPYDTGFHTEHNIKHLSFHAHLRKQDIAMNKPSRSYIPPLQPEEYSVKIPCPSGQHPDWPAGICTKCQPSAITLQRQPYRMVDHVEFAHPQLVENLLGFWRATGLQRFAFLVGRYEPYDKVPMGVKAVVEEIVEPPQEGDADGLTLGVPWEDAARIEGLARLCGNMALVGMIYTDLSPLDPTFTDPEAAGKVLCKRHKDSFFLSGCEAMFSAALQSSNPNPSRFSATGKYNSKFVTCVISGTDDGAIDVSAYQMSEQGMGMVSADMIEASVNPNIIRVRNSEGKRYVPEVFYRYTNEYKIDVKESAKPTFPVEYLLVTATHGFPNDPKPTFLSFKFPIENRPGLHDQTLEKALSSIASVLEGREIFPLGYASLQDGSDVKGKGRMHAENGDETRVREKLVGVLSDWHLVCFLDTTGILDTEDMRVLCKVAVSHDATVDLDNLLQRTGWQTLAAIAREHAPQREDSFGNGNDMPGTASIGEAMGGQGGASASARESAKGTGAYAGKAADPRGVRPRSPSPRAPMRAPGAANPPRGGSGTRPQSPILYTGSDDEDSDFHYDEAGGNDEDDEDDEMFEDAATHSAPDSARHEDQVQPSSSELPSAQPSPPLAPAAATTTGAKVCPHCTFENAAGASDCDICGLPLS